MSDPISPDSVENSPEQPGKRDFLTLTASATAAVGAGAFVYTLGDTMNPAADVLALASTEVNIGAVTEGQSIRVMWRGKPVFIRRRTKAEIDEARSDDSVDMPDPEVDAARVKEGKEEWLVVVGICTHLGCVPLANKGEFDGWLCPCHGSHYDVSGRMRKGPAPLNLEVPPYQFLTDDVIQIG